MKSFRKLAIGALAALAFAAPANAHRMWMLPSTFTLSGEEQWITVDGAISNDLFFPNHVPLPLGDVRITAPDGTSTAPEGGWTGKFRSSFDVKLDQQGTWKIAEEGAMFFAMWEENGERNRRRGSMEMLKAQGLFDKAGVQLMKSQRRVETFVTLGAPTTDTLQPKGVGVELVPVTHPNDVYVGEEVTFRFTVDGVAKEGLEVEVVRGQDRYRDDPAGLKLTTDADGNISFTLEEAGRYWLETGVRGQTEVEGKPMGLGLSYVATFEALIG